MLEVQGLGVDFSMGRAKKLEAVADVSFSIKKGEVLGLVGESGCGKSSLAMAVLQLPPPSSGKVLFFGQDLAKVSKKRLRQLRPGFQIIFQDSVSALNPKRKIGRSIAMSLDGVQKGNSKEKKKQVLEMMELVGLDPDLFDRKPHELSGGQCQRVQIARALMTRPDLLILDEPVSSLDVSVQAQILNLLEKLRKRYGLSMLFISHDLAVVKNVCDRVAVMYGGKLCEMAPSERLYQSPAHPYTRILLNAIPRLDSLGSRTRQRSLSDTTVSPLPSAVGCRFRRCCPKAGTLCDKKEPEMDALGKEHWVACHFKTEKEESASP